MSSDAYIKLSNMSRGYEYYADAYVGDDAPFKNMKPDYDTLCKIIQEMCDVSREVLSEYRAMEAKINGKC